MPPLVRLPSAKFRFLSSSFGRVFLAELVNTAGSVNDLLCAGIERMAFRTYFNAQRGFNHS